MIVDAVSLRNEENLKRIPVESGWYKWWAKRPELDVLLEGLGVSFSDVGEYIEERDGWYCIYVGIASSVQERLGWHINQTHTPSNVKSGYLSTLRQSLSSILAHDQLNGEKVTNDFIDLLKVEYFVEAKENIEKIEEEQINQYLRILNIDKNHHPQAKDIVKKLKNLRNGAKAKA